MTHLAQRFAPTEAIEIHSALSFCILIIFHGRFFHIKDFFYLRKLGSLILFFVVKVVKLILAVLQNLV